MQEGGTSRLELEEQREINFWQTAESRPTWERQGWPELRPARAAARRRRWREVIILTSLGKLSRQHSHAVTQSYRHTSQLPAGGLSGRVCVSHTAGADTPASS